MNHGIFHEVLLLLASSVVVVALFRRIHLPPILGYLAVGVLAGPNALGWVADTEDTRFLAEFGVVFLMFTIGLEFSPRQLLAMRAVMLGLGGAQVLITTVGVAALAWWFGIGPFGAVIMGGAVAMSSTAIVTKQLLEQTELQSRHGRLAVAILLFQDVAVIFLLVLMAEHTAASDQSIAWTLLWALMKAGLALTVMPAIGHWLLRPLFHEIASARSSELFTLTVLLFTLTAAWVTDQIGLSLALGAFLAGIMLGETEFRHQVEADIRPFRDVLLGLFFITVGMLLDLRALPAIWYWVLAATAGIVLGKTALIAWLSRHLAEADYGVALRTGLVLAQGGEFGLALLSLALSTGLVDPHHVQIVLAATLLSMALAPLVIRFNGTLAKRIYPSQYHLFDRSQAVLEIAGQSGGLSDHVVLCGYGRVGQNLARLLEPERIPYFALDLDPQRVREARAAGEPVHYGDATHAEILLAAGLRRARALVITFDETRATIKTLHQARRVAPDLPILVRTRDDVHLEELQKAGATEVVPETLEASLMLASHLLLLLDVPVARVIRRIQEVRGDRYRLLRAFFHGEEPIALEDTDPTRERLHAVAIHAGAHAVGRTLAELDLEAAGVQVMLVRRGSIRAPQPTPNTELRAGDVVVLYGTPERLERAESILLQGKP